MVYKQQRIKLWFYEKLVFSNKWNPIFNGSLTCFIEKAVLTKEMIVCNYD